MIEMKENQDSPTVKMNEETRNLVNISGKDTTGMAGRSIDDNDIENENMLVNIKQESQDPLSENGGGRQEETDHDSTHMSPVETATLLLLSRIALFNKVCSFIYLHV